MKFRKKPVVIDAVQWDGANVDEVLALVITTGSVRRGNAHELLIDTLEGTMLASRGDWIIKGIKNELYPCKPDIFEAIYEPAETKHERAGGKSMNNRPPLGIMPRWIHQSQRLHELAAVICRYTQNDEVPMIIPIEWVTEYNELSELCANVF